MFSLIFVPKSYTAQKTMKYKKLLIQQQRYNGSTYVDVGSVVDTQATYKVVCQEFPFKHLPEIKDLPTRDWHDEHGEDVYIPTDGLKFKAYDLEAKFLFVGTESEMHDKIVSFIDFIYGRNNGGAPMLKVYDEYTKTGRRGVVVQSVNNELYSYNDANSDAIASFKIKFRVTDPVTSITLSI